MAISQEQIQQIYSRRIQINKNFNFKETYLQIKNFAEINLLKFTPITLKILYHVILHSYLKSTFLIPFLLPISNGYVLEDYVQLIIKSNDTDCDGIKKYIFEIIANILP